MRVPGVGTELKDMIDGIWTVFVIVFFSTHMHLSWAFMRPT